MLIPPPGASYRRKVLLIEDSRSIQILLTDFIRTVAGLELVAVIDTAARARATFPSSEADIVILDLVLTDGNGLDLLREFKQSRPRCLFLVFSGHDSEPYRARCRIEGADSFYSKIQEHKSLLQHLRLLGRGLTPPSDAPDHSPIQRSISH